MKHIRHLITPTLVAISLAVACAVSSANAAPATPYVKHVKVTFDTALLGNSSYELSNYWAINPNNAPLREIVTILNLKNELAPYEPLTLTYVYYNTTGELQKGKPYTYKDFVINGTGYFSSDYFDAIEGTFAVTNVTTAILSARLFYPKLKVALQNEQVEDHYFMDSDSGKTVHVTITSRPNGLVTLDLTE